MPIATTCPHCAARFELPDTLAHKSLRCAKCQGVFTAPPLEAPAEPPSDAPATVILVGPAPEGAIVEKPPPPPPRAEAPPRPARPSRPTPQSSNGVILVILLCAFAGLFAIVCVVFMVAAGFYVASEKQPIAMKKDDKKFFEKRDFEDRLKDRDKFWDRADDKDFPFKDKDFGKDLDKDFWLKFKDKPPVKELTEKDKERKFWAGVRFPRPDNIPPVDIFPIPRLALGKDDIGEQEGRFDNGLAAIRFEFERHRLYNISLDATPPYRLQLQDGQKVVASKETLLAGERLALSHLAQKDGPHVLFITRDDGNFGPFKLKFGKGHKPLPERPRLDLKNTPHLRVTQALGVKNMPDLENPSYGTFREIEIYLDRRCELSLKVHQTKIETVLRVYRGSKLLYERTSDPETKEIDFKFKAEIPDFHCIRITSSKAALGEFTLDANLHIVN